jgi:E3 ubiquitin-protein ligase DOA10
MVSAILGWLLVVLGIVSYVTGLVMFVRAQLARPVVVSAQALSDPNLEVIKEILEKLDSMLASFAKLSVPVQWAILGLLNIGVGAYLIANRPF